jgi:NAD(P)-dependent dehydrogenase (short-subunit alcohol dehydrogenase family)
MANGSAWVFGATGGIGAALVDRLAGDDDFAIVHAGARVAPKTGGKTRGFQFDLTDEASIAAAVESMADAAPDLVIVATGALAFLDGALPEKSLRAIDKQRMAELFLVNTVGPALIAKHVLAAFPRDRRSVFAVQSARVGSIADNRLGGWHSYRASKAALNMLVRNFGVEMRRTHPHAIVASLHPGTVDTKLSRQFQRGLPDGQLATSEESAANLLRVIDQLSPTDSGGFFAWDGTPIPY